MRDGGFPHVEQPITRRVPGANGGTRVLSQVLTPPGRYAILVLQFKIADPGAPLPGCAGPKRRSRSKSGAVPQLSEQRRPNPFSLHCSSQAACQGRALQTFAERGRCLTHWLPSTSCPKAGGFHLDAVTGVCILAISTAGQLALLQQDASALVFHQAGR
jgi:hypothetical protein